MLIKLKSPYHAETTFATYKCCSESSEELAGEHRGTTFNMACLMETHILILFFIQLTLPHKKTLTVQLSLVWMLLQHKKVTRFLSEMYKRK